MPFCCTAFDDKAKECERRREIAVQRVSLGGGSSPVRFTMAANTKVSGDGVRRLTFVVSKCVTSGALRMKNVHIHAATAGDCQPRQETVKSCLDAGLAKPLTECTCESYSRAVNLDSSSFGKCVGRSRTRCQMFAGSVSTAISGTTRPNVVPDTASTATMQTVVPATPMPRAASTTGPNVVLDTASTSHTRTTPGTSRNILTRSQTDLSPVTTEIITSPVTTSTISEHPVKPVPSALLTFLRGVLLMSRSCRHGKPSLSSRSCQQ